VIDFGHVRHVRIPKRLVDASQTFLRKVGLKQTEGMLLWLGHPSGEDFIVTEMYAPRQKGIRGDHGICVVVDTEEMRRINVHLYETGQRLIAQVHSHPQAAYHSEMDDQYAIATTVGSLSIVIPDFAAGDFDLHGASVHRLHEDGHWVELTVTQARSLIIVED
jgi:hypothetical protein